MKLQEATYIYMMLHAYRSVRYMQYALRMHHASLADCIRTAESTSNSMRSETQQETEARQGSLSLPPTQKKLLILLLADTTSRLQCKQRC